MDALVRGYNNYDGEILGQVYNSGTKAVGEMVHSGYLDRDDSNVWYYYEHKANCYLSPYQMYEVIDTYKYTAKQNDEWNGATFLMWHLILFKESVCFIIS